MSGLDVASLTDDGRAGRRDALGSRPGEPVLSVAGMSTVYGTARGQITAVHDVSFEITAGEAIGIVGESGCGKTALALSLMALLPRNGRIAAGTLLLGSLDLRAADASTLRAARGRRIAMVFQDSMTSLDPVMPVGRQITEGMATHLALSRQQARGRAVALLDEVGVPEPATRLRQYPHQLSGGLRQRVANASPSPPTRSSSSPTSRRPPSTSRSRRRSSTSSNGSAASAAWRSSSSRTTSGSWAA